MDVREQKLAIFPVSIYTAKYIKEGSAMSDVTFHFSKGGKNLGGNCDVIAMTSSGFKVNSTKSIFK
jgi:hypothetical protein